VDFEVANRRRDRRLRRRLLETLHDARIGPKGGLNGRFLRDVVAGTVPSSQGFEDDDHTMGLIRDLVNKDYVTEEREPMRRGQRFGIDFMFLKITAKGSSLASDNETHPVDPDIDDDRDVET
jgi:hypothetical protein